LPAPSQKLINLLKEIGTFYLFLSEVFIGVLIGLMYLFITQEKVKRTSIEFLDINKVREHYLDIKRKWIFNKLCIYGFPFIIAIEHMREDASIGGGIYLLPSLMMVLYFYLLFIAYFRTNEESVNIVDSILEKHPLDTTIPDVTIES
jgi:hypothetical protein